MEPTSRTWAEINLSALEHNYAVIRNLLPIGCKILAPVKADAYGHGAVQIARKLEQLGVDYFAVADLEEGIELRQANIGVPILILGRTDPCNTEELLHYRLTQSVCCLEDAIQYSEAAASQGKILPIHIKIDTGMTRLGLLCHNNIEQCATVISDLFALSALYCEGIFTHFSAADSDERYTMLQFERFQALLNHLAQRGLKFAIRHCAASAAMLNYPCTHLDMVRPGLALYGHYPCPNTPSCNKIKLYPVMSLKTRIISVRTVPANTAVSYGCTHILSRASRLAVLGIGYGDGLPRACSDKIQVYIKGSRAPVIGRICMDLCMIDITDLPQAQLGDEVEIWGEHILVETIAEQADTISYELLCRLGKRVPRIYNSK